MFHLAPKDIGLEQCVGLEYTVRATTKISRSRKEEDISTQDQKIKGPSTFLHDLQLIKLLHKKKSCGPPPSSKMGQVISENQEGLQDSDKD